MKVVGAVFVLVGMWTIYELGIKGLTLTQAWTDVQKFFNLTPSTSTTSSTTSSTGKSGISGTGIPGSGVGTSQLGKNGMYGGATPLTENNGMYTA